MGRNVLQQKVFKSLPATRNEVKSFSLDAFFSFRPLKYQHVVNQALPSLLASFSITHHGSPSFDRDRPPCKCQQVSGPSGRLPSALASHLQSLVPGKSLENTSRVGAGKLPLHCPGLGRTHSHDPRRNALFQPQMAPSELIGPWPRPAPAMALGARVSLQTSGCCPPRAPPRNPPKAYPASGGVGGSTRGAGREERGGAARGGPSGPQWLPWPPPAARAQGRPKDVRRRPGAQRQQALRAWGPAIFYFQTNSGLTLSPANPSTASLTGSRMKVQT